MISPVFNRISNQKLWPGFYSSPCFDSGEPCLKGRPPFYTMKRGLASRKLAKWLSSSFSPRSTALQDNRQSRHVQILAFFGFSNLFEVRFDHWITIPIVVGKSWPNFRTKQSLNPLKFGSEKFCLCTYFGTSPEENPPRKNICKQTALIGRKQTVIAISRLWLNCNVNSEGEKQLTKFRFSGISAKRYRRLFSFVQAIDYGLTPPCSATLLQITYFEAMAKAV